MVDFSDLLCLGFSCFIKHFLWVMFLCVRDFFTGTVGFMFVISYGAAVFARFHFWFSFFSIRMVVLFPRTFSIFSSIGEVFSC